MKNFFARAGALAINLGVLAFSIAAVVYTMGLALQFWGFQ